VATDYLYLTNDASVFLRYVNAALKGALEAAPDAEAAEELQQIVANSGVLLRSLKKARNTTLSRYTPTGERKPAPTNQHQPTRG
jgi:hypothetical protein